MFFEEFIQQHRVHGVVANGIYLAIIMAVSHQIRTYLLYLLGNQSEAERTCRIKLTGLRL